MQKLHRNCASPGTMEGAKWNHSRESENGIRLKTKGSSGRLPSAKYDPRWRQVIQALFWLFSFASSYYVAVHSDDPPVSQQVRERLRNLLMLNR